MRPGSQYRNPLYQSDLLIFTGWDARLWECQGALQAWSRVLDLDRFLAVVVSAGGRSAARRALISLSHSLPPASGFGRNRPTSFLRLFLDQPLIALDPLCPSVSVRIKFSTDVGNLSRAKPGDLSIRPACAWDRLHLRQVRSSFGSL